MIQRKRFSHSNLLISIEHGWIIVRLLIQPCNRMDLVSVINGVILPFMASSKWFLFCLLLDFSGNQCKPIFSWYQFKLNSGLKSYNNGGSSSTKSFHCRIERVKQTIKYKQNGVGKASPLQSYYWWSRFFSMLRPNCFFPFSHTKFEMIPC